MLQNAKKKQKRKRRERLLNAKRDQKGEKKIEENAQI